jgi:hypothetical protein
VIRHTYVIVTHLCPRGGNGRLESLPAAFVFPVAGIWQQESFMEEKEPRVVVTPQQWAAVAKAQSYFGLPDRVAADMLGCGYSTVFGRRKRYGWALRKPPRGLDMTSATSAYDGPEAALNVDGPEALQQIMGAISAEVARAGHEGIDTEALKRIDTLTAAARTYERLMDVQARHTPADATPTPLEETQAVLAEMDRRVDELAERRARYFIGQWCETGGCMDRLDEGKVETTA